MCTNKLDALVRMRNPSDPCCQQRRSTTLLRPQISSSGFALCDAISQC